MIFMIKKSTTASIIASGCTIGVIFAIIFLMSIFLFIWFIVVSILWLLLMN